MDNKPKTQYRISMAVSVILIAIAGIFDLTTAIPVIGSFMGPLFWVIAGIYFWLKGMGIVNGKRLIVSGTSFILELFPGIQIAPTLIGGIIIILLIIRIEDKTGLSIMKPLKKRITPPKVQRIPVNATPGVRPPRLTSSQPNSPSGQSK